MSELTIVVAAFNRRHSLERCLRALLHAAYPGKVRLVISIDHCETNGPVRELAHQFVWPFGRKRVIAHEERLGLRNHIMKCGNLALRYGRILLLEDDLFVSPDYYNYALQAVQYYEHDKRIAGISLYAPRFNESAKLPFEPLQGRYDVYFGQLPTSWGQIWTASQWAAYKAWYDNADNLLHKQWDKEALPRCVARWPESSWKKYYAKYMIDENKVFVYPYVSHSTNFGDVGTHFRNRAHHFQVPLSNADKKQYVFDPYDRASVVYDASFENIGLGRLFERQMRSQLTIDLYGTKQASRYSRYVLTTKPLDYRILGKFDLTMKPLEENIRHSIPGNSIFLYDTTVPRPFAADSEPILLEQYFSWEKIKTRSQ
ncbi:glycosyltransferase family 2 protein [Paenibacillus koleovorans]|uniref:glycosyltransferase family 2 protein n=1 Tax=Paenibacillus koleovorans TaxID=121608 RepID=UPI000FDAEEBC|nr:glycosyltransferase [Paenibacillus koleovorans]